MKELRPAQTRYQDAGGPRRNASGPGSLCGTQFGFLGQSRDVDWTLSGSLGN